jgi:hypothetical protein
VDLAAFTTDLASVFRAAFERAGLAFEVHCPPILQQQPTAGGHRYPQIQFMTDGATEFNTSCDVLSGKGCVLPPRALGTSARSSR